MDRREFFLKTGLLSAAIGATMVPEAEALEKNPSTRRVDPHGKLDLSNDTLAWHLIWHDKKLVSSGFDNKLSGHSFKFSAAQEFAFTFSASEQRVEIPWWRFAFIPDVAAPG